MLFLSKSNFLKDDSVLLFANIYSDKVSVFAVSKDKQSDRMSILASSLEPQEGSIFLGSALDIEKIALNFHKALLGIPADVMKTAKNIIVGLDGGISGFKFCQLRIERPDKDKRISQGEIDGLTGKNKSEDLFIGRSIIDGFVVSDPVGLNGKELVLEAVSISLYDNLVKALEDAAAAHNISIVGFINMPKAAFDILKQTQVQRDFLAIFIFANAANIVVVRGGAVANIGNLDIGYGIISKGVSEKFGVGMEEAKNILNETRNGSISGEVGGVAQVLINEACGEFIGKLKLLLSDIDKVQLLPNLIIIGTAENAPELMFVLSDKQLIDGLPFEKNAEIVAFDDCLKELKSKITGIEKIGNIFDFVALDFVI